MRFLKPVLKPVLKLLKLIAPLLLIASLAGCVPASSGPRTQAPDPQRGKVEIRIENHSWNIARVYVSEGGSLLRRIATVDAGRSETKYVRINNAYFVFVVTFFAGDKSWVGLTEWSSREECLHLKISNAVGYSTDTPCLRPR